MEKINKIGENNMQPKTTEEKEEIRRNKQNEKEEPDNTKIACFKCGCEEYIDTELPYSLFRMCTAHRNKLNDVLKVDFIY